MPHTIADPPTCCSPDLCDESKEFQQLRPDPSAARGRDARGRFAQGYSGNPRGRPRGIGNPKRRVPDILARPLTPTVLSDLVDRKPHLLPALAAQVLPPPCPAFNPGDDLGIDVSSLRTAEDCRDALSSTLAAMASGDLSPAEGAIIARRVDARLSADRRAKRLHRRLANLTDPVRGRR